jgi:hypothetical protein
MIDVVWQTMMGMGLAASAGLRAFLPLLVVGVAGRFEVVALGEKFTWMTTDAALIVFGVAVVLEVLGDKIPVVDHVLDAIGTFARPVAGALAAASPLTSLEPLTATVVGVILGASVAGGVHAAKATTRLFSTGATAGLATPFLSAGEDAMSFTGAVLAIFLPVVAFAAAMVILFFVFRSRRPRPVQA